MKAIPPVLVLVACSSGPAPAPPGSPAATPAAPAPAAAPAGPSTALPSLGLRIGCEAEVFEMKQQMVLVTCKPVVMTIYVAQDARTIDDAIAAHDIERTHMLEAGQGDVRRTPRFYRHAYQNAGGDGTNYWEDVIREIDGRVIVCQSGSLGANASRDIAKRGGDLCEQLSPLPK